MRAAYPARRKRRKFRSGYAATVAGWMSSMPKPAKSGVLNVHRTTFIAAGIGGEGVAGSAGRGDLDIFYQEGVAGGLPERGFDAANAADTPFVVHESVDEEALIGIGGVVMFVVFGGELGEILGGFVEHDLVNGVDAVLQGVESGCGLSRGGAGSG